MNSRVSFVDVGQGDCTIAIDHESRESVVLDCPAKALDELLGIMDRAEVLRPSVVILSHSDTDHMAGAVALVRTRGASEVRYNHDRTLPADSRSRTRWKAALRALAALEDAGVATGPATNDVAGRAGDIEFTLIAPTHGMVSRAQVKAAPNHASAVVKFVIGSVVILIGGDADAESWRRLLDSDVDLRADVFRLPHHGASLIGTAVSWDGLLGAVRPQAVVISVAATNAYGHPAMDTLTALQRHAEKIRVMCTEINSVCLGSAPVPHAAIGGLPADSLQGLGARPGAIRCAGTVSIEVGEHGWRMSPSPQDHGRVIDELEQPMCRPLAMASRPRA